MKAHYNVRTHQLVVEVEGLKFKDVVQGISEVIEVSQNDKCGCCSSNNVRLSYRKAGNYDFYEVLCEDCDAALALGVRQVDGKLFPRHKDNEGNLLPNGGWRKWQPGARGDRQENYDPEFDQAPAPRR